jgi:GT2 family glycosyltransferase
MDISVVVPTFNRRELVTRSIETLLVQNCPPSQYEIIVVVDGSTDGTGSALSVMKPPCKLRVIEQANRGPAAARNTGYRAAETNLVLFIDDDMLCDPGLVAAHFAAHQQPDNSIAFGALFLSEDSPSSLAAECFNREIGALHLERKRNPDIHWKITDCVFSNASLSRSLLDKVGGFDEAFRLREDLELGARLFNAGIRAQYIPSAVAYQHYRKTSTDLIREAEGFAVADVMFARKHPQAIITGQLHSSAQDRFWKRSIRRVAAGSPAVSDLLLRPICALGEACFRVLALRNLGVRALQMRRRIHWLNKALEMGWQPSQSKPENAA